MAKKHLFSRLLKKAIYMALWTKAILCGKSLLLEQRLSRTPSRLTTLCPLSALWLYSSCRSLSAVALAKADVFVAKNLFNQRNTKDFVRRIHLFMQNKAKFKKVKFYVNKAMAREYEQKDTWWNRKNKAKTKPIKANSKPIKANLQDAKNERK